MDIFECIQDLQRDALTQAERSCHVSGPDFAAILWEGAREKYALAIEVEFFGEFHPYFGTWKRRKYGGPDASEAE